MSKSITPGPWKVKGPHINSSTISVIGPEKEDGWCTVLAELTVRNVGEECALANARLIAAAPDLLEACKRMMKEIDDISIGAEEDMLAAIAKAEAGGWES